MKVSEGTLIAVGGALGCLMACVCAVLVRRTEGPAWLETGCWLMCVLSLGLGFLGGIGG